MHKNYEIQAHKILLRTFYRGSVNVKPIYLTPTDTIYTALYTHVRQSALGVLIHEPTF